MKNLIFNFKAVQTGSYKAELGAEQIVSAPQYWLEVDGQKVQTSYLRIWELVL